MRKPYPDYKPSGFEWLGQTPKHWEIKRLKYVATLNPKASEARKMAPDTEVSFVPMEAVGKHGGLDLSMTKELSEVGDGYTYFSDGDVVVAKITPCFENGKGALAVELVNGTAFGTTELHVVRCRPDVDKQFTLYMTLTSTFRKLGESEMYGAAGQKRIPESFITNLKQSIPPLFEQRAIAAFLDRETARIDQLIAKHELLTERLGEYRKAVITRAVTKGLPPNAAYVAGLDPEPRLKPSGIEWVGNVPEHWDIRKLKQSATRTNIKVETEEAGDTTYIGLENISPWVGSLKQMDDTIEPEGTANVFQSGDILFCKLRPYLAKGLKPATPGVCSTEFIVVTPTRYEGKFLLYLILTNGFIQTVNSSTFGAKMPRANWDFIGNQNLPLPPMAEQRAIIEYLDQKVARIDALSERAGTAIERLNECRTALITAAVTGKIDVRESAAAEEPTE